MLTMIKRHVRLRVAQLLDERGLTQEEFSNLSNLHIGTVSRMVRDGNEHIALETIGKVCVALNVTPNDIFEYNEEDFKSSSAA